MGVLKQESKTTFFSVLKTRTKVEVVVSFLALLELVKRHLVQANQEFMFGDIELESLADWDESNGDMEFEFIE